MKPPRLSTEQINALFGLQLLYGASHRAYVSKTYLAHGECDRMTLFVELEYKCHRGSNCVDFTRTYVWDHREGFCELAGVICDDPNVLDALGMTPSDLRRIAGGAS